jgi:hypothetical protein
MKNIARTFCLVVFVLAGWLNLGCQCRQPCGPAQQQSKALIIPQKEMDLAWDETLEVLREHYFVPDRQDRREGLILSYPELSRQWFEFWRDDSQGSFNVAESSVQSIRRIAVVNFVPDGDDIQIWVDVNVQRKNQPQRQITTASGAIQVFRDQVPLVITGRPAEGEEIETWVDLGKDTRQANYLLERIERRLPEALWMIVEGEAQAGPAPACQ